jgi:hypothetical protein
MPKIHTQKEFRNWPKPKFCYLCGKPLDDGTPLNDDHCPPAGMFLEADRQNYPIILKVHAACNSSWSAADEKFATMYAVLHGLIDDIDEKRRSPRFVSVSNEQGEHLAAIEFPLSELVFRITQCAHALLYGEWLPKTTRHAFHIPVPEVDTERSNSPKPHRPQASMFAKELCTAQKTQTCDSIIAYGRQFKYVTTWVHADRGEPLCLFAMDIYRLHRLGISIDGFPKAVIGSYQHATPMNASRMTSLVVQNSEEEMLYPILI